jgi:hypothetical protein
LAKLGRELPCKISEVIACGGGENFVRPERLGGAQKLGKSIVRCGTVLFRVRGGLNLLDPSTTATCICGRHPDFV